MAWIIEFYANERGVAPIEEFFDTLPDKEMAHIQYVLELLEEFGLQLGSPYVEHLKGKIWELRVKTRGKTYRILYFAYTGQRFILLHAFLKKTAKTPQATLRIAQARLADFLEREG
jgi:phage-related protein